MSSQPIVDDPAWPAFVRELAGTVSIHSQYVINGDVYDRFLWPDGAATRLDRIVPMLWAALQPLGYRCLIRYDQVHGLTVYPDEPEPRRAAEELLGAAQLGGVPTLPRLREPIASVVGVAPPVVDDPHGEPPARSAPRRLQTRAAFVIDYAARLVRTPNTLTDAERELFLFCHKAADTAPRVRGADGGYAYNPVIWLSEGERELPAWFTSGSEKVRVIAASPPGLDERTAMARLMARHKFGMEMPDGPGRERELAGAFAQRAEGLSLSAMADVAELAVDRGIPLSNVDEAIRVYKLGVSDNPWQRKSIRAQIREAERTLPQRVIGQDRAVAKTLDILKRAALGLSGAQATSPGTRPRGVLMFTGPTGVGKTELAKNIAELLFGDRSAYLRFDMSEFAAEHSADRLVGSPPGYVGFEAGGELTGAVRRKPFQVVLFDEIDKAHPLVLDKFLQILEDGRLTDGQGNTTYFSECVLIFTSNLGITVRHAADIAVSETMPYEELEKAVLANVKAFFVNEIKRPELLNRFGDNIVVFNFISEEVAHGIVDLQLSNVASQLYRQHRITLAIDPAVRDELRVRCTADRSHGGRGIGNLLETNLVNPLSREAFEIDELAGTTIRVTGLHDDPVRGVRLAVRLERPGDAP